MSQFEEKRTPYEFLVRWDSAGNISGAHVAWLDTLLKDGEIINQSVSNAESVAFAEQAGFPLEDILSTITLDSLKRLEELNQVQPTENINTEE